MEAGHYASVTFSSQRSSLNLLGNLDLGQTRVMAMMQRGIAVLNIRAQSKGLYGHLKTASRTRVQSKKGAQKKRGLLKKESPFVTCSSHVEDFREF